MPPVAGGGILQHLMGGNDFVEGVRALLLEKDGNPVWKPSTLQEVSNDMLNGLFAGLGEHELSLVRGKL